MQATQDLMEKMAIKNPGAQAIGSLEGKVSAEEWQLRVDLAATYRLVAQHGWDDMIFTHISARVPGPEHHFLINPYGLLFEEITASSLVKIDLDGNKVQETPYPVNPAGFTIHSALHMNRDDAHCIIHLHTTDGVAVSAQADGLLPIDQHAMMIATDIAYHDFEGVAVDLDERDRLVHDVGKKNMMMLRNHGTLALGKKLRWMRSCACTILSGPARCRCAPCLAAPSSTGRTRACRRRQPVRPVRHSMECSARSRGLRSCASSTASTRATGTNTGTQDEIPGVGQSVRRTEDIRFITGQGQYTDDLRFDNEAHVAFHRSPHGHARIKSVDISAAKGGTGRRRRPDPGRRRESGRRPDALSGARCRVATARPCAYRPSRS